MISIWTGIPNKLKAEPQRYLVWNKTPIFYSACINHPILLTEHMLILPCTKWSYRKTNKQQKWKEAMGSATTVSIQQQQLTRRNALFHQAQLLIKC